ncbi:MAG TPA: pyridoxal-dependent decarboxylase, partial [Rubrivivax sp.]|nr:pyridoxal-dependent decarboxylase [Rubrivivax sp.]
WHSTGSGADRHRRSSNLIGASVDPEFSFNAVGLARAVELLRSASHASDSAALPTDWPATGMGSLAALEQLAPHVVGGAAGLGVPTAFAHMDPPTPWVTWAASLWNASLNQNLLHPATAPVARDIEARVLAWLAPSYGMDGGHLTPGSTLANLTALWAARECAGVKEVLASQSAHLSVQKAAHLLGLRFRSLPVDDVGALRVDALGSVGGSSDLSRSVLVLTAGTTSTGAVDPLSLAGRAAWTHVDAAWAGPLRLSPKHANRLAGIEEADSVAVSAHKWLFQPKESALVLFRDSARAHAAISFGGAYLATPNVGLLGSHGAAAVLLMATLMAWGREGLAARVDHCMALAQQWAEVIGGDARLMLHSRPATGVVLWRPVDETLFNHLLSCLPPGSASITVLEGTRWFRNVAANPNADVHLLATALMQTLDAAPQDSR